MNSVARFRVWSAIAGLVGVALLVCIVAAVQTHVVFQRTAEYAEEGRETILVNLEYQTEPELCRFAHELVAEWGTAEKAAKEDMSATARRLHVDRVSVVGSNGVVLASSEPKLVGFDFASHTNTVEFLDLNGKEHFIAQPFRRPVDNPQAPLMKFVGIAFQNGGFVQIGDSIHPGDTHRRRDYVFVQSMQDEHISNNGYFVIVDPAEGTIVSTQDREKAGGKAADAGFVDLDFADGDGPVRARIFGQNSLVWRVKPEFFDVVGYVVFPLADLMHERDISIFLAALLFLVGYSVVYVFLLKISGQSARLREQNAQMEAFHAREASARQRDLMLAKNIQVSALPCIFPPFPSHREIDLYALFRTAKEVGGDFYDFFFVSPARLCLVIADVSDKGVPAALFMMKARSMIKSCVMTREKLEDAMSDANGMLCTNNVAGMFVTAWVGVFDLDSGELEFVTAGHNPPYILRKNGELESLKVRPSLVLSAMEGVKYRVNRNRINPGETLFLYTDGVTEATSRSGELFGEKRLEECLCAVSGDAEAKCRQIVQTVDGFAAGVPQSDDITVLAFSFKGSENGRSETFPANLEGLSSAAVFLETCLDEGKCSDKTKSAMMVALDEIASNIMHYSGAADFTLKVVFEDDLVRVVFSDSGKPYDPLEKEDPDVSLSAAERKIGGLGIFMVKRMMDEMHYVRDHEQNILTIGKKIA